ncbi:TAXI family TRAP transporter solute-binding subunit [Natronorubrum aibiense]|uniref:TAXI family TRAP transporter solute-binding subunit n=1 Tax=Natronorubrum aibiense TaxID=348826 RepID=A0A5P9P948_9EURY|nr:TAXI family TRAP transporter solute-binding subunit [Natronorubrum aibiense]QFU84410.1 TAXI family TRAP transporter solute-binding subunit [Natronorubrum aibiense]
MVNQRNFTRRGKSRRAFLTATGIGATTALAGCLGNDDSADEGTVRMRTSESTTAAYAANEGIAAVINDYSDNLFVEAQTSSGTEANIGALNNEEAEMVYIQNWSVQDVVSGEGAFGNLDFEMAQIFHFYDLPWFFCTANEEMSTISDIDGDTTVSPTPEGSGTAPALERAIGYATDDYERISIGYGEQASAMNEGRLDVGVGTYMNFGIVPGWTQEMMGTIDFRVLGADNVLNEWEDDDRLLIQSFDGDELEDAAYTPDEVHCPTFAYNFVSRADLDYDTVYNFLETMHENRAELEDYSAVLARMEEEDFWVENMYDEVPFHAAAADFYEEKGLWHDDFERHDEP